MKTLTLPRKILLSRELPRHLRDLRHSRAAYHLIEDECSKCRDNFLQIGVAVETLCDEGDGMNWSGPGV